MNGRVVFVGPGGQDLAQALGMGGGGGGGRAEANEGLKGVMLLHFAFVSAHARACLMLALLLGLRSSDGVFAVLRPGRLRGVCRGPGPLLALHSLCRCARFPQVPAQPLDQTGGRLAFLLHH